MAETLQFAPWTTCCARRPTPRRGISGSAASAGSSPRSFAPPFAAGRRRSCSTAAAAPARTSSCLDDSAAPTASTCPRSARDSPARRAARRLPAPPSRPRRFRAATFDLVTSFDVLYSLEEPDERAAVAELFRLLKPGGFAHHQRRRDADADRRSLGAQPRTAPLHAVVASALLERGRLHDRPADLHERHVVPSARDRARVSPVARPVDRG